MSELLNSSHTVHLLLFVTKTFIVILVMLYYWIKDFIRGNYDSQLSLCYKILSLLFEIYQITLLAVICSKTQKEVST